MRLNLGNGVSFNEALKTYGIIITYGKKHGYKIKVMQNIADYYICKYIVGGDAINRKLFK